MTGTFNRVPLSSVMMVDRHVVNPSNIDPATEYVGLESISTDGRIIRFINAGSAEIRSGKHYFTPQHILFGKLRPYLRKIAAPDFSGVCSTDIIPLLPRSNVDKRYLLHWLRTDELIGLATNDSAGANLPRLSTTALLDFPIPLPPFDEQKRIAAVLDKADALRRQRQESLQLTEKILQAIFIDMFGDLRTNPMHWPETTVGEILCDGPQNGLYQPRSTYGSGTRILRIDGFYDGAVLDEHKLKRLHLYPENEQRYLLREGDIVVNRVNSLEFLGKSAVIPKFSEPVVFESNIMRMGVNRDRMEPRFLIAMLQTPYIKRQILSCAKIAINQASINQTDVKGLRIFKPPITLQQEYIQRIEYIVRFKNYGKAQEATAVEFFSSIQQRAFRGELDLSRIVLDATNDPGPQPEQVRPIIEATAPKRRIRFSDPPPAVETEIEQLTLTLGAGLSIPWSANYFKYRILATQPMPFSFAQLMQRAEAVFSEPPPYEEIQKMIFELLGYGNGQALLRQRFDLQIDKGTGQVTGKREIVFESAS